MEVDWRGEWTLRDGTVGAVIAEDGKGAVIFEGRLHITQWDAAGDNKETRDWDLATRKRACAPPLKDGATLPKLQETRGGL